MRFGKDNRDPDPDPRLTREYDAGIDLSSGKESEVDDTLAARPVVDDTALRESK